MSILLSLIALIIFVFVHIISLFVLSIKNVRKRKWYYLINKRHFQQAYDIDIFGNYQYKETWNFLFSRKGYRFGRLGETISSVLGKKQKEKSLTLFGWIILIIINIVDFSKWFKGGHCKASIQDEESIKKFINKPWL